MATLSDPVTIAMIVAVPSVLTIAVPVIMSWMTARQLRTAKSDDNARLDLVASRADRASAAAEASARILITSNHDASLERATLGGQMTQIHTLVNSNLEEQMRDTLDAMEAQLASMKDAMDARREAGHEPSPEALDAVKTLESTVARKTKALVDRKIMTDAAAKEKAATDAYIAIKSEQPA